MASTDVSATANARLFRTLTFRNTRGAFFLSVIVLLLLGALGGILKLLEVESPIPTYIAAGVVVFMFINALISVWESTIAVCGLTLVSIWIFLAVAAPILPLHAPSETTTAFREKLSPISQTQATINIMQTAMEQAGQTYEPTPEQLAVLEQDVLFKIEHEGKTHWLSVDNKGRDLLSRIVWGAQRVLFWATIATVVAYTVGMLFGVAAGYMGGWIDEGISFFANVMLAFPVMVLFILMVQLLGQSGGTIIIAVTFASAPGIMRIVRGLTLDLRSRDYIAAAQTRGESPWYIMVVELLPNARGPLIVDACLRLGYTTIAIATLSFLGLGLPPPDPDWGAQMNEAREVATSFPHMLVYPALALSSLILGFNMLADGLRDISLRD